MQHRSRLWCRWGIVCVWHVGMRVTQGETDDAGQSGKEGKVLLKSRRAVLAFERGTFCTPGGGTMETMAHTLTPLWAHPLQDPLNRTSVGPWKPLQGFTAC